MRDAFVEHVDYKQVYEEYCGLCFYCRRSLSFKESHFDHFVPIAKGGKHEKSNIRLSCPPFNRSKAAKMPGEVCH
jgi:5-methylcytosine-specific restriction endonuclease McrA